MHIEEHNHCFMHYFGVKTLSETLFFPPLMNPGDGTRPYRVVGPRGNSSWYREDQVDPLPAPF